MTSVGTSLRSEREAQGRTLAEIADELCIMQSYLHAIEADDLQSLPGTFFYKSFVRQYASMLGLKPEQFKNGVEALTAPLEDDPPPPAHVPAEQRLPEIRLGRWHRVVRVPDPVLEAANKLDISRRNVAVPTVGLGVVLLVCSAFYAWWSQDGFSMASDTDAGEVSSAGAVPSLDVTTTTTEDGVQHVALNLSATEETWVSITSGGKQIFSGMLEPSETKTIPGLQVARMKVGNAGGIDVRWNGQQIGPLGKSGQVRTVLLTPEGAEILPPANPPTPGSNESL